MIYVIFYPVPITGHISIELTGLKKKNKNIHISFYPQLKKSKLLFRLHSLKYDGTDVTRIVAIPTEESCGKGPSEQAIYEWFQNEFNTPRAYGLINKNCSSFVYKALIEGQDHAKTLDNKRLLEKSWFCSPGNVMSYSEQLSGLILKTLNKEQALLAELTELKDYCEFEKMIPFEQAMALYFKIKKFPQESDSIMLRKPFCKFVKKALKDMRNKIPQTLPEEIKKHLIDMTESPDLTVIDMDHCFTQLRELAEYIYSLPHTYSEALDQIMQTSVTNAIVVNMKRMIENLTQPNTTNASRIEHIMKYLDNKIDDEKNPWKENFLSGTKRDLGLGIRMLGY